MIRSNSGADDGSAIVAARRPASFGPATPLPVDIVSDRIFVNSYASYAVFSDELFRRLSRGSVRERGRSSSKFAWICCRTVGNHHGELGTSADGTSRSERSGSNHGDAASSSQLTVPTVTPRRNHSMARS